MIITRIKSFTYLLGPDFNRKHCDEGCVGEKEAGQVLFTAVHCPHGGHVFSVASVDTPFGCH